MVSRQLDRNISMGNIEQTRVNLFWLANRARAVNGHVYVPVHVHVKVHVLDNASLP